MLSEHILNRIADNLADIGAIAVDDYLNDDAAAPPQPLRASEPVVDANAVTRLHQACQRALRNTDALKFEFIEQSSSRQKQCILTITKPDGAQRSYATQPTFVRKVEAKSEAARLAIEMGALDFLAGGGGETKATVSAETSPDGTAPEAFIDNIEQCCREWRAGHVTPHWVPFFDPKAAHKQGYALRIQLSPHVVSVYLCDPIFDSHTDAKGACAKAAVMEGVLDFIKHGNGQSRPSSPGPSSSSIVPPPPPVTPWTLQGFYDSLPRPFPESFAIDDTSGINAPGWLNSLVQNARGGKLLLSFFFTSDGPPGLHGCLLKLDRSGEYKAFVVDARFPKRSDAKAAVCLQAMSMGIGNYIRSIASDVDTKVTPVMRSFSSSLVYPALTSELGKINAQLHPHFEYDKERDAFGATMVVRLSTSPAPEQVRRYTVPSDYRNKADAKVAVICHAADQGVVEFARFQGGTPPQGYTSPYVLHAYNPDMSRKRKQPGSAGDAEQSRPAKKRKKGKRRAEVPSQDEGGRLTPVGQHLSPHSSSDQIRGISGPDDMGPSQGTLCDLSQPSVGSGVGSGARPAVYSHPPPYHVVLDPRFTGGGPSSRGYGTYATPHVYSGGPPPPVVDVPQPEVLPRTWPGSCSRAPRRPAGDAELEPGEVVSSTESEFSESSSRNEDEVPVKVQDPDANGNGTAAERVEVEGGVASGSQDKGKGKEVSPTNTSTTVSRGGTLPASQAKKLIDYCVMHRCGTPSFHEVQSQGRFQVWIVIGKERFDLPRTYETVEEGRERVARQVLARLSKGTSG